MEPGERMPIRLVQENGETISLDATSVDIVVERQASNFGIPFFDAKKMGIDLNQASVAVEIQGVFADETGQEVTSQSQAIIDFYQPQQLLGTQYYNLFQKKDLLLLLILLLHYLPKQQ